MSRSEIALQDKHREFNQVWGNPKGLRALTIVNHTTIGIRFMVTATIFFLIGGLMAMLMRTQLALPAQQFLTPDAYNQLFTMHGTVMMFLFAVPFMEGLAIYLVPKMIGARDLVFPRISVLGYFCFLFGGLMLLSSLLLGVAPNTGWFMYTPLTSKPYSPGLNADFWLLGVTFVEISAIVTGIELVVSIARTRAPKMALHLMPLYCWYILVMALMIVFGFPPLILGSLLLELERAAGFPFFDVAKGGDPILWQHLFWLFGHPDVYIIFLPAAGIVSTLIPVFARRPMVGYRWVVLGIITTGFISFGVWVHHMFTVGIPKLAQAFFSVASMLVAIPTAIQLFAWLATLLSGRPVFRLPMLWITGFLIVFVAGGLTGVMLAMVPFDWQVHDTQFVVAHLHYVVIGSMFFPLVAGLYYWMPHFTGRMASETMGRWAFGFTFVGFNTTFLIMHWTGLLGMPRRVYTYAPGVGWDWPNLISSIGSFIMAIGIAMILLDVLLHFRFGRKAPANPWGADTLEWATSTPPSPYNFISLPECPTRHPLWDYPNLPQTITQGKHTLAVASHGRRETWGTDPVTGEVREIIHLPANAWIPFFAALTLAVLFVSLLLQSYTLSVMMLVILSGLLLRWSWENGTHPNAAPHEQTEPGDPPLHSRTFDGPGLWGMAVSLLVDASMYMALLFGWLYLWTVAPLWHVPEQAPIGWLSLLISGLLLSFSGIWYYRLMKQVRKGHVSCLQMNLWGIAIVAFVHVLSLLWVFWSSSLQPTQIAHDAVVFVMFVYVLFHSVLALIMTIQMALRKAYGYIGKQALYEPIVVEQWWLYTIVIFWVTYAAIILFPLSWAGG